MQLGESEILGQKACLKIPPRSGGKSPPLPTQLGGLALDQDTNTLISAQPMPGVTRGRKVRCGDAESDSGAIQMAAVYSAKSPLRRALKVRYHCDHSSRRRPPPIKFR